MNLLEFKKYTKVYILGMKTSLSIDMQYKADFFVSILHLLLHLGFSFVFIEVLYLNVNSINGWSKYDLWLLSGIFEVSRSIYDALFYEVGKISRKIQDGNLDTYIIKPMPILLGIVFNNPFLFYVADLLVWFGVIIISINNGASINLFLGLIVTILMIFLQFAVGLFLQTLNFFTLFPDTARNLSNNIIDFGKTPANFFNFGVRTFFSFVFPLFLVSGVAFGIDRQEIPPYLIINVLIVVLTIFYLSIKFWKQGLSKYSSASS